MESTTTDPAAERELQGARDGDEGAFQRLVEPYRGQLHAHCYRMLGSVHDAEDALQEAMLRAWRGLEKFEGRSSTKSWLYKIATNTCLDSIAKRPKRVLPVDYAPAGDPHQGPGEPVVENVWVEPYPDETLGLEDGLAGPEASYEERESVELAFIAALQHLPANQRAVLILREVLGFSAKETAESLETSVASVNSALQRARVSVDEKTPDQSQQETLRALGDDALRKLVDDYLKAWESNDVDTVVNLLAEDATFTMPPLASWFSPLNEIEVFLRLSPMSGDWKWRAFPVWANGQPALAYYTWDPEDEVYKSFALNVLTIRDGKISDVTAFISRAGGDVDPDRAVVLRMPEIEADEDLTHAYFSAFGLPERFEEGSEPKTAL